MLSLDFVKLIFIALIIAFPFSWWLTNNWLNSFAYRSEIGWSIFAVSGVAAILIALLTISYQSVTTALQNPVDSLRSE
jgi:putative ABC transport system permease protein